MEVVRCFYRVFFWSVFAVCFCPTEFFFCHPFSAGHLSGMKISVKVQSLQFQAGLSGECYAVVIDGTVLMDCFLSLSCHCQCLLNFSFYAESRFECLTQSSVFEFMFCRALLWYNLLIQ